MNKRALHFDYIECVKGWQAEVTLTATWTAYTTCMPTKEACKKEIDKLKKMLGINDE